MAPRKNTGRKGKNLPVKHGDTAVNVTDQLVNDAERASGFENMGADDIAIPFIVILQALSPQVRGQGKIKGAQEGYFFNTVTNEVLGDTIYVIPCAYEKAYVEWVPRNKGGGFVTKHSDSSILDQTTRDGDKNDVLTNGNHVVTTAYHYCLLVKENYDLEKVVISLTSTQLKKSRRWNSTMLSLKVNTKRGKITPPMYSHVYKISGVEEENDYGQWTGWHISEPKIIDDMEVYNEAKTFHNDVTKGAVRLAPPPTQGDYEADTGTVSDADEIF